MTRKEIIRMAREAGCGGIDNFEVIERFAALVAAAERNILAAWMIQFGFATGHGDTMEQLVDALGSEIVDRIEIEIDVAVAAEREACAKVCDDIDVEYEGEDVSAIWCAAAIRARSNT